MASSISRSNVRIISMAVPLAVPVSAGRLACRSVWSSLTALPPPWNTDIFLSCLVGNRFDFLDCPVHDRRDYVAARNHPKDRLLLLHPFQMVAKLLLFHLNPALPLPVVRAKHMRGDKDAVERIRYIIKWLMCICSEHGHESVSLCPEIAKHGLLFVVPLNDYIRVVQYAGFI